MNENEKGMVDLYNQEMKELQDSKKQIEEMAKIIALEMCPTQKEYSKFNNKATCYFAECKNIKNAVDKLINAGYRKLPEDSVVLTMQEWKQIKNSLYYSKEELEKKLQKARKETAEKFLNMIYWKAVKHIKGKNKDECFIEMSFEKLDELAKQYGVEVEE